ncbi:MAG: phosphotransferase enzyme family protein [Anaerolineae bacterium]
MITRASALELFERAALDAAAACFGTTRDDLRVLPGSEGCQNLVYAYDVDGIPMILRASFRPDRGPEQIRAEVHFVDYLARSGVRVAYPVPSRPGNLMETFRCGEILFTVVSFIRGRGMRVPDNGYRYRDDAPIEEYFRNWGEVLGQMHRCAKSYVPAEGGGRRPDLMEILDFEPVDERVPAPLQGVREKVVALSSELRALPRDRDGHGLIHGDFNDGNFTVDYSNGDITVFDFDDCCYGWFAYELAAAWEGGVGRVMFRGLAERKAFMDRYFALVLEGYERENTLSEAWLARLPLFLRVIQMQELLYYLRYFDDPDDEIQAGLRYKIRCVEDDIPYLGFFDPIYSPERPFCL